MRINISDISFESRPTIDQDEINALAASIKDKGLLHPITVAKLGAGYKLVTGLKRLLAVKQNGNDKIEVTITKSDTPAELHIHENLMRYNLPWYEQVELRAELHNLRQQEFGKANPKSGIKDGWSLRDTAKELQISLGTIAQDMQLAEAIANTPSLRNIKDKPTALKMMKMAGRRLEAQMESGGDEESQIFCGNALDILPKYPAAIAHACITDPPWLEFHGEKEFERDVDTLNVFKEIYRVLRPNSFLYAFVGVKDFHYYWTELPKLGFEVSDTPLIWSKSNVVSMGKRAWEYDRDFELIVLAVKGSPILVDSGRKSSILSYTAIPGVFLKHPNEKPLEIINQLITDCTYENSLVIDPFAGSGTVPHACKNLNRRYIGIEKEHRFYKIMEGRCSTHEQGS